MGKKKRPASSTASHDHSIADNEGANNSNAEKEGNVSVAESEQSTTEDIPIFKDRKFVHSGKGGSAAGKKNRVWKTLKQIIAAERSIPNTVTYLSLDSPPSIKPTKKYSDVSGLIAKYTDPVTKLRFSNALEFQNIRTLPPEIINGYLALRRAAM